MAKMKKIVAAGPLVREAIYPRISGREPDRIRAAKQRSSTEAQKNLNRKNSYEKLMFRIAANFSPGDIFCTLTFDDAHLPESWQQTKQCLAYFRKKLSDLRKKNGQEFRALWTIENKTSEGRWHAHMIVNAVGNDYETIRKLWTYGRDIDLEPLTFDKDNGYEAVARYMCKEKADRANSQRCWSGTKGLKKEEVETFIVPDDSHINIPDGAVALDDRRVNMPTGYEFISYYFPAGVKRTHRRKKNVRRRNDLGQSHKAAGPGQRDGTNAAASTAAQ